jgi:hypothetical protein
MEHFDTLDYLSEGKYPVFKQGKGGCLGMANKDLHDAKKIRNDEFYTQLTGIEKELKYYRHYFKGKTILCNCDDLRVSRFFYFLCQFPQMKSI